MDSILPVADFTLTSPESQKGRKLRIILRSDREEVRKWTNLFDEQKTSDSRFALSLPEDFIAGSYGSIEFDFIGEIRQVDSVP